MNQLLPSILLILAFGMGSFVIANYVTRPTYKIILPYKDEWERPILKIVGEGKFSKIEHVYRKGKGLIQGQSDREIMRKITYTQEFNWYWSKFKKRHYRYPVVVHFQTEMGLAVAVMY